MLSKYEELLEEARERFEEILEQFEKEENPALKKEDINKLPAEFLPFVEELGSLLSQISKEEDDKECLNGNELDKLYSKICMEEIKNKKITDSAKHKKIYFNIFYEYFELLMNLISRHINVLINNVPSVKHNNDFLRLVNIFNYFYLNENYKKTKSIEEIRKKLINFYKDTLYSFIFISDNNEQEE